MRQLNDLALKRARAALHVAVGCLIGSSPGVAAVASAGTAAAESSPGALTEIVITAEHIKEDAQTTPIAMSVFGSEELSSYTYQYYPPRTYGLRLEYRTGQ